MKSLLVANFLGFQIGWFAAVLGAAFGMPWLGPCILVSVLALHVLLSYRVREELILAAVAGFVGLIFDSLLVATGWVSYPNGQWHPLLAPYWIVAMWMLFATTLNVSMRWLHGRPWLAFALGAIGGPVSYLAGEKLGAMLFLNEVAATLFLAAGWGLALPSLVRVAVRFDGFAATFRQQEVSSS